MFRNARQYYGRKKVEIKIDSKVLDFTLEKEENSFDVINAIYGWLDSENIIISRIEIDGKQFYLDDREELKKIKISDISCVDIETMTLKEFRFSQLLIIQDYFKNIIDLLQQDKFEGVELFLKEYPKIKHLLESVIDRVYNSGSSGFIETLISRETLTEEDIKNLKKFSESILIVAEERKKEISETREEILAEREFFENFVPEIGTISILLQTGKDSEAMEKIIQFIDFSKKFSRLLSYYNMDTGKIEPEKINEYNRLLNELADALGRSDSVLVGDLLEYELTPAIENFFELMSEQDRR